MKIINRVRPDNSQQKCYVLEFDGMYGHVKMETFLTEKEVKKYEKAGIKCQLKEV